MSNPFALWRDIAVILLALEALVLGLIPLLLAYYVNKGVRWLIMHTRPTFAQIRGKMQAVNQATAAVAAKAVRPFIAWHSLAAGIRGGLCALARKRATHQALMWARTADNRREKS